VPVVGRIAQADEDGTVSPGGRRLGRLPVGTSERVGQVNVRAAFGQRRATVAQSAANAQFGHGVGAGHGFEAVEVGSQRGGLARHGLRALFGNYPAQRVLDDAQQIGPRAGGGIENDDAGIGESARPAERVHEQAIDQADLGANDLDGSVVDPGVPAQVTGGTAGRLDRR